MYIDIAQYTYAPKGIGLGTREMVQSLEAYVVLIVDLSLIPSTHTVSYNFMQSQFNAI